MPRVILEYRRELLTVHQIRELTDLLKRSAAIFLSTTGAHLNEEEISVKFVEAGEHDDLTHDVILHVSVQPYGNRRQEREMIVNNFLAALKSDLKRVPRGDDDPPPPRSIGVSLTFIDSEWVDWWASD